MRRQPKRRCLPSRTKGPGLALGMSRVACLSPVHLYPYQPLLPLQACAGQCPLADLSLLRRAGRPRSCTLVRSWSGWIKERWWRRRGLNPRPPRCERGALPAELLPHPRAGKHSRRFSPVLSIRARRPGEGGGESFRINKVFLRSADQCIEQVPGFRREHAPSPVATEKISAVEKTDWREQRGDEVTPQDGTLSTFPSRSVARGYAEIHAGQGLAPHTLARDRDFLLTKRAIFWYSKPSPRD